MATFTLHTIERELREELHKHQRNRSGYSLEGRKAKTKMKGSKMSNNNNNGIGFCSMLFIVFLVLKLCGTITWSWLWVLSPLWIPFAFVAILAIIIILCK